LPSNAVNVVVNPIPATPVAASNSPICAGTALNLTSSNVTGTATYAWVGPNSFTSAAINPSISNATTAATGAYGFTVTQNGCTSAASTPINVTVNAVPAIGGSSLSNTTTCATATGSITLNGLAATTTYTVNYTFGSTPKTATITSTASGDVVINNLTAGTYTNISVTVNNCTSNTIAGPFTISDPTPPAKPSIASNNSPVCSGTPIVLTATSALSGVTYTWTTPGGSTVTGSTLTVNNSALADAGTYNVTVTLNSCVSSPEPATVVVKPTPVITGNGTNPTTCATATGFITLSGLTASTAYTVNYTKNSVAQSATLTANASGSIVIPNLASATYANVTVTLNGCTSAAVGPFVLSDPNPPATPTITPLPSATVCTGNNLTLTASTATTGSITYNWTSSNGFTYTGTNAAIQFNNVTTAVAGTYSVTATLNSCVSAATPITIVVNTTPVITAVSANPTDCNSATGSITIAGLVANTVYTVNYEKNAAAQTTTLTSNTSGNIIIPSLSAGTYSNINVILNACPSNVVGPFTLTDPAAPGVTIVSNNSPICETATINVVANSIAGATLSWTSTTGYTTIGNTVNITNATTTQSGTYTVTATKNSCTSTATALVQVNPNPVASFTSSAFVCMPNGVVSFTNNSTVAGNGSMTYAWDFGDATTATTVNATHTYANIGNYPVKLTTIANGCSSSVTNNFNAFLDKPIAIFKIDKDTICQGVSNTFTDLSTAPNSTITNWAWNFGDGSLPSTLANPTKLYSLPGNYTVTLVVKNAQGCTSDVTPKPIKVYLQPKIDAGPSFVVPQGTTIVFNPTTNDSTTVKFLWTPSADFAHPDSLRPALLVLKNQKYKVTATGEGKCEASDTLSVIALKALTIPNAFSPNGDRINDTWEIGNLIDYAFATVEIFNRSGQLVFKSKGYSTPWDGTFNGKSLPVGTYYYIIDFKNAFPTKSGYVVILR
jgi:gliding motility-associated-like protein